MSLLLEFDNEFFENRLWFFERQYSDELVKNIPKTKREKYEREHAIYIEFLKKLEQIHESSTSAELLTHFSPLSDEHLARKFPDVYVTRHENWAAHYLIHESGSKKKYVGLLITHKDLSPERFERWMSEILNKW